MAYDLFGPNAVVSALSTAAAGAGLHVEIGTRFGSVTVDPSTGASKPGDSSGGAGAGQLGMAILDFLQVTLTLKTPAGKFGPFPVANTKGA
jgi:hypothetical protein